MGLADIIRSGVAIANSITSSLQTTVSHEAWIGSDKYGKPIYETAVERMALVERRTQSIGAQQLVVNATITFIYPVDSNGSEGRQEPIDPRDRITLPDGWTGPIVSVNGLIDPMTGLPYLYEVSLGNPGSP